MVICFGVYHGKTGEFLYSSGGPDFIGVDHKENCTNIAERVTMMHGDPCVVIQIAREVLPEIRQWYNSNYITVASISDYDILELWNRDQAIEQGKIEFS